MKKSLIVAIAVLLPTIASAAPIVPGAGGDLNCIPLNSSMAGQTIKTSHPELGRWVVTYQGQEVCGDGVVSNEGDTLKRLYNLEVAVADLQAQNATLQSKMNLMQAQGGAQVVTTGNTASLEARVSALESITKSIQQSLVFVIQLLTDALNKLK